MPNELPPLSADAATRDAEPPEIFVAFALRERRRRAKEREEGLLNRDGQTRERQRRPEDMTMAIRVETEVDARVVLVVRRLLPILLRPVQVCRHCRAGVPRPHIHEVEESEW